MLRPCCRWRKPTRGSRFPPAKQLPCASHLPSRFLRACSSQSQSGQACSVKAGSAFECRSSTRLLRDKALLMWVCLMATAAFPPQTGSSPTSATLLTSTETVPSMQSITETFVQVCLAQACCSVAGCSCSGEDSAVHSGTNSEGPSLQVLPAPARNIKPLKGLMAMQLAAREVTGCLTPRPVCLWSGKAAFCEPLLLDFSERLEWAVSACTSSCNLVYCEEGHTLANIQGDLS